jgi:hypothetical protein
MKLFLSALALGVLVLALSFKFEVSASADTIDLSTSNPSNWTVTGGNAMNTPAFAFTPLSGVSITSGSFAMLAKITKIEYNGSFPPRSDPCPAIRMTHYAT